jgi:ubiquinone/menaquinone biosynthesis C-methylase UbiE
VVHVAGQHASPDKQAVPGEFNLVARRYDLLCRLNPGYTRHLRWSAERLPVPDGGRILELCCGTGLSTEALVERFPRARITALDASAGMLQLARAKRGLARVAFVHGDAMDPAASGIAGPFDGIFMAYGIRNMPDADLCLRRICDLLAPGAVACFHEYSVADSRLAQAVWRAVSTLIVVPLGQVVAGSGDIFRYLRRSVLEFDGVTAFNERLRRAGFTDVGTTTMDGWQRGIVHPFIARRPS